MILPVNAPRLCRCGKKSLFLKTVKLGICMLSVDGSQWKLGGCSKAKAKLLQTRDNREGLKDIDKK